MVMRRAWFLLFLSSLFPQVASAAAKEPVMDVYVSTGDNHYLGSSLPIDSPASMEATFDLFQRVNRARRVYWRGLEASCWLATMTARPSASSPAGLSARRGRRIRTRAAPPS